MWYAHRFWRRAWKERGHLKDTGVDTKIISKWLLNRQNGEAWTGLIWLRNGKISGSCERGKYNIKFLDHLKHCYIHKKTSASWSLLVFRKYVKHSLQMDNKFRSCICTCFQTAKLWVVRNWPTQQTNLTNTQQSNSNSCSAKGAHFTETEVSLP